MEHSLMERITAANYIAKEIHSMVDEGNFGRMNEMVELADEYAIFLIDEGDYIQVEDELIWK